MAVNSMFLLQGSFNDEDWVQKYTNHVGEPRTEIVTYYSEEIMYTSEEHSFKFEHKHDDVYERVETIKTVEDQYAEWCKEGKGHTQEQHNREMYRFTRLISHSGFGISFDSIATYARFCEQHAAGSHLSEYQWVDGSPVLVFTDYWGSDDY